LNEKKRERNLVCHLREIKKAMGAAGSRFKILARFKKRWLPPLFNAQSSESREKGRSLAENPERGKGKQSPRRNGITIEGGRHARQLFKGIHLWTISTRGGGGGSWPQKKEKKKKEVGDLMGTGQEGGVEFCA